jgi:hypothetical protein
LYNTIYCMLQQALEIISHKSQICFTNGKKQNNENCLKKVISTTGNKACLIIPLISYCMWGLFIYACHSDQSTAQLQTCLLLKPVHSTVTHMLVTQTSPQQVTNMLVTQTSPQHTVTSRQISWSSGPQNVKNFSVATNAT